ncbi:MAG: hypothetical protein IJ702_09655 [Fretibacterium sp.]|nr:hypothetical protein [Fretibacterium sp.]
MNNVYESIMAGLNEAAADALGEIEPLARRMVELPDEAPFQASFPSTVSGMAATGQRASVPA